MKITNFIIFLSLTTSFTSWAQRRNVEALSIEKKQELGSKLLEQGGYYAAIGHFKAMVEKYPEDDDYIFKLAEAYYYSRDYKSAEKWYQKLSETARKGKKAQLTIATFHYAESLKYNGKYEKAREIFDLFASSLYKEVKGENYKLLARNEVLSCEYALLRQDKTVDVEISHMDSTVNSGYSDFSPRPVDDTTLIFASMQIDSIVTVRHGDRHFEHTKLYKTHSKNGTQWSKPEQLPNVNSIFQHSANGTYNPDKSKFYFTRCKPARHGMLCKIYVCDVVNGEFKNPKKLNHDINQGIHTATQPHIVRTVSGKTENQTLYYSSNRKGGVGGTDIWYVTIDKQGNLSKAQNCGRSINSIRDEVTPFYDTDAGVLYFSSNFHYGFGGYDVFRAKGALNKFSKSENVGIPINSSLDDVYYTQAKDKFKGFLVSNRPGGTALMSETCCDDMYTFTYKQPTILVVSLKDSTTKEPITDILPIVKVARYKPTADSLYTEYTASDFDTLSINTDPGLIKFLEIDPKPKSFYVLQSNKYASISASKPGYRDNSVQATTDNEGLFSGIKAEDSSFTYTSKIRYLEVEMYLAKGENKKKQLVDATPKRDTVHIVSSLMQEFEKTKDTTNIVEVIDSAQKIVSREFNIQLTFEYNKVALKNKNLSTLDSLVTILKKNTRLKINFTTHTDNIGSDLYNMDLSYKRAEYVANYFISKGIKKARVRGKGEGETRHIFPNQKPDGSDYPEGRQQNRRTEIQLLY